MHRNGEPHLRVNFMMIFTTVTETGDQNGSIVFGRMCQSTGGRVGVPGIQQLRGQGMEGQGHKDRAETGK